MSVDPTAIVGSDVALGQGIQVGAFAVLGIDGADALDPLQIGADSIVRSHVVVYRGTRIGKGFHAGHGALVRESTKISDNVSIGSHSIIEHHVQIGSGARVHGNVFVPEYSELAAGCWVGPCVTVTNAKFPNQPDTKDNLEGVCIGEGAVVGASAVLLPGVRIGAGAIIGAGAVVVRDVRAGTTVVGNPGRVL